MTGEPVFTSMSAETEAEAGPCCAKGDTDATLTSAAGAECEASGEKGCCKDKADAVDVTETPEAIAPEGQEVVAELTEAE